MDYSIIKLSLIAQSIFNYGYWINSKGQKVIEPNSEYERIRQWHVNM